LLGTGRRLWRLVVRVQFALISCATDFDCGFREEDEGMARSCRLQLRVVLPKICYLMRRACPWKNDFDNDQFQIRAIETSRIQFIQRVNIELKDIEERCRAYGRADVQ